MVRMYKGYFLLRLLKSSEAIISHLSLVQLCLQLIVLSKRQFVWANFVIVWLRDVCEDNHFKNTHTVLSSVGVIPFLHLLTLWADDCETGSSVRSLVTEHSGGKDTNEGAKFQFRLSKVFNQFIGAECGHFRVEGSQLPSGFDASHLLTLLSFCSYCLHPAKASVNALRSKQQSSLSAAGRGLGTDVLHATEIILDCLCEMTVGTNLCLFLSFVRSPLSTNQAVWSLLLDLLRYPCAYTRTRSLRLTMATLATPEGRLDMKQLVAFDKFNGFGVMAEHLSVPAVAAAAAAKRRVKKDDDPVIDILLDMMFWKVKNATDDSLGENVVASPIDEAAEEGDNDGAHDAEVNDEDAELVAIDTPTTIARKSWLSDAASHQGSLPPSPPSPPPPQPYPLPPSSDQQVGLR